MKLFLRYCFLMSGLLMFLTACSEENNQNTTPPMTFVVFDVGQGLSQGVVINSEAIVFDAGPREGFSSWQQEYIKLGRPFIQMLSISHAEADHFGALALWDSSICFSGVVVVGTPYDTGFIRAGAGWWQDRISFQIIAGGDTSLNLPGLQIECLHPAVSADIDTSDRNWRNKSSLCFRIGYRNTSVLLTSDIDSVIMGSLTATYGQRLSSDIMVLPHHGSAGSFNPVFCGQVNPDLMIISCSRDNSYGHPSPLWYSLAFQLHTNIMTTFEQGSLQLHSNGFYWE